ncbi:hypothetical protein [Rhodovibrio salinarum]|uniref:Uncharacterized protein n=1 Tax=Rhodovibrio salinarum TaxID=1087 RepID=A0A934V092_9PROT|nr:hypothetical protein [Rhodovibrio salinarum]MBK1697558.1 hypothetical protein [Rhodovibrio salinarum]
MRPSAPEQRHLATLRAIAHLKRGTHCEIDPQHARECCEAGWATVAPGDNQFHLTEAGRELLAKASELEK